MFMHHYHQIRLGHVIKMKIRNFWFVSNMQVFAIIQYWFPIQLLSTFYSCLDRFKFQNTKRLESNYKQWIRVTFHAVDEDEMKSKINGTESPNLRERYPRPLVNFENTKIRHLNRQRHCQSKYPRRYRISAPTFVAGQCHFTNPLIFTGIHCWQKFHNS